MQGARRFMVAATLTAAIAYTGCGTGPEEFSNADLERDIQPSLEKQLDGRFGDSIVKSVTCVQRDDRGRCYAVTRLKGLGVQRLGIDVTFGEDGYYLWEVTP